MADKEVKVLVTTEADVSQLEDFNSAMEEATKEVERLQDALDEAHFNGDDIEADRIADELAEAEAQAESLSDALNGIDSTGLEEAEFAAEELDNILSGIDGSGLDEASNSAQELADGLNNASESAEGTISGMDGLGSALTAVAGAASLDAMVETADNINNSWNRLSLTFAGTGVSIDLLKQKQAELQASTGQTGGTIRNFFNAMGIAGVTNVDLLSSSFEALSGKAYQLGISVEDVQGRFQRMVMTGNASGISLQKIGVQAEDLARVMGVSASEVSEAFKNMTPEERIQALTKAMGDGREANEMYKNSFQGLKNQAEGALAGLVGAVGQAILPFIIPVLQLATSAITTLTNAFKSLPAPIQALVGGIGGVILVAVTLIGTLGVVGQVIKTVKAGIEFLTTTMKIWETVTKAVEMAQAALNFVMELNPIILVITAIIALIAILWYLYNTNEDVRNAINWVIDGFMQFCEMIWGAVTGAIQWLISLFTDFPGTIQSTFSGVFDWLQQAWANVVSFFQEYGQLFLEIFFVIATGGTGAIVLLLANIGGMPTKLGSIFQSAITKAGNFITSLASKFATGAMNAVNGFMNYIKQLPGKLWAELTNTLNRVISWGSQIVARFGEIAQRAWQAFLNGLGIHSPGYIQVATLKELDDTGRRIPTAAEKIVNNLDIMSTKAVNAWGDPEFDYGFQSTGNVVNNNIPVDSSGSGSVNYIFNLYGDMDNEDRMEKFLEAVRREIAWNNETAGRTV